jgi:hypothetical protein
MGRVGLQKKTYFGDVEKNMKLILFESKRTYFKIL